MYAVYKYDDERSKKKLWLLSLENIELCEDLDELLDMLEFQSVQEAEQYGYYVVEINSISDLIDEAGSQYINAKIDSMLS